MNNNNSDYQKQAFTHSYWCSPRQGPSSITIGTTTTRLPGTQASVLNTKTNEDVILNFTILFF